MSDQTAWDKFKTNSVAFINKVFGKDSLPEDASVKDIEDFMETAKPVEELIAEATKSTETKATEDLTKLKEEIQGGYASKEDFEALKSKVEELPSKEDVTTEIQKVTESIEGLKTSVGEELNKVKTAKGSAASGDPKLETDKKDTPKDDKVVEVNMNDIPIGSLGNGLF